MEIEKTKIIIVGILAVTIVIVIAVLMSTMPWGKTGIEGNEKDSGIINTALDESNINLNIQMSLEKIKIQAKAPESRLTLPLYRAYYAPGDIEERSFGELDKERFNLTTAENAPDLARNAMEPYGGIPTDAYVSLSVINKEIVGDMKNPTKIEYFNNQVYFSRTINGIPITGMDDGFIVWLGENGKLLRYKKFWRTLEKVGDIPIIPVDKAIKKLENGEVLNPLQNPSDITINSINLRYYAKNWNKKEIYFEPVYEFYATFPNGQDYQLYVYARQFANFTATPTRGNVPLTVTFTDTSDASPITWFWDFGDGTNSTVQNPAHIYTTAGTYNVSLRVWNDLGSDTMIKPSAILIGKKAIVRQIDTTLNESVTVLDGLDIQDGVRNSLMQKLENARKNNDDALKFIDQDTEDQANNMLSAEDNLMQAFVNEVAAQTGKAISTDDTTSLNTQAAEIRELIQNAVVTSI